MLGGVMRRDGEVCGDALNDNELRNKKRDIKCGRWSGNL